MNKAAIKRMTRRTEFYIFLVLLLLIAVVGVISDGALIRPNSSFTILRAMVVDGMFALCSLVVMISGGFDLSFPAVSALSYSLATTICLNNGWCQTSPVAAFALAVVFGWCLGMFNGWIISNFKLNTMIVTLGTQTFFTGLSMGLLQLKEITSTLPQGLKDFGSSTLLKVTDTLVGGRQVTVPLTSMIIFLVVLVIITSFVLNRTMFGRALYAIGGNEVSAERAGYNVKRTKFLLYSVVGAVAGFTGMLRVCMASQSIPKALVNKEMTIIPAVILGGASIFGGEGSVFGTMCAVGIITVVSNSMLLMGIDTYWQDFFNGLVILIGVTVSALQAMRRKN